MNQSAYEKIAKYDKSNILDAIASQPAQLRENYGDEMRADIVYEDGVGVKNIVFVGMGGSALAGGIAKQWLKTRLTIPFDVTYGESMPAYVSSKTLVVVSSYSGNTAETLAAYAHARKYNALVIVMTAGGKLEALAKKHGDVCLRLPRASQPRLAVMSGLKALACVLQDMGLVESVDLRRELLETADYLDTQSYSWYPQNTNVNFAYKIATKLIGKTVLVYTSPLLASAGYKWKIDINETAKQMAFFGQFSEINHNEMQAWQSTKSTDYACVVLSSNLEPKNMQKRVDISRQALQKVGLNPIEIVTYGQTIIGQLLYAVLLGDYVSAYLAIANKIDPTVVPAIEKFKKKLSLEL